MGEIIPKQRYAGNPNWVKGMACANPGGRLAGLSVIRDKALTISIEGLAILRKIILDEGEDTRNRLAALNMCLDRACGKPLQPMQIEESNKPVNAQNLTTSELSLLVNGKAEDFLRSLFLNGSLMGYVQKFAEEKGEENDLRDAGSSADDSSNNGSNHCGEHSGNGMVREKHKTDSRGTAGKERKKINGKK
jgi:hypothetical protein